MQRLLSQYKRLNVTQQYFCVVLTIGAVAFGCYWISSFIGYRVVAFILLITVSLLAMIFRIGPVLFAACLSAIIWDFLFIPPRFTLHVGYAEDVMLLLMYFIIAMVNAALTNKVVQAEKIARRREGKENTLKLYNTVLNSLSHELRTPIATIVAATDNLQDNNTNLTLNDKHELVEEIAKAALRLNSQVENLLNISRIESGFIQPKKDWCDVNEVIHGVVRQIEETGATQKISINISPDIPLFKLDKGLLEQILYNILINAATYTPSGAHIEVKANCHVNTLKIIIEDNGPGFPEEEIDSVFDKFYRLKNTAAGGTGLGLSIVKGFTEALGGNVELKNKTNGGACFAIAIPVEISNHKDLKDE